MGDVLTVTKPGKRQCGLLRQDLLVILRTCCKFIPSSPPLQPPFDNQKSPASGPADRQEEMRSSDVLREGWKREVWVNGRPESPPVRPNQDQ